MSSSTSTSASASTSTSSSSGSNPLSPGGSSTSTSAPVSTSTSSSSGSNPLSTSSQGNLYLFTFLSTLLVLLLISCSIVFRSFVLRRRYQRRLAEALASGAILAPRTQGSRRKRFRTRPKFFDTWISEVEPSSKWAELMPVSVLPVKTKKKHRLSETVERPNDPRSEAVFQRLFSSYLLEPRSRRRSRNVDDDSAPSSPSSPGPVTPIQEKADPIANSNPTTQKNVVQVAVLVAMPCPPRPASLRPTDEEQIPEVAFGVTRLLYRSNQGD
ncbi:hypothetical protein BT96DRAFT_447621 [Gymnopus androsaceus JB14]|uniref:Uncharacterized protein n=1 Tax=Gymnopus androsaceus JB14 TaxID=1447944 RepID=A0A6A4I5K1_9AGAR|nr:hypothetical protein BT96DRAFT_447621 [Gymnopus androsaceus JB14]